MRSHFTVLLFLFCSLFSEGYAHADFAKDIGHISRDPGGETFVIKFPSAEPGDSLVTFTVRDYDIRFHSLFLNFEGGDSFQYVDWIDFDERGDRRFILVDRSLNIKLKGKQKLIGMTLQLESYGGPGILKIAVKSGSGGGTTPPTPPKPPTPPTPPKPPTPPVPPTPPNNGTPPSLVCLPEGANGSGAQPAIENSGQKIGNGFFRAATDCEVAIGQQEKNILCAVNVDGNVQAMRASDRKFLGDFANPEATSCFRSIVNASKTAICLQGQNRNEYALFGIKTGKWLDANYTSRDQCFAAVDKTREVFPGTPGNGGGTPNVPTPPPSVIDTGNNLDQCLKFATEKYALDFSATSSAEKASVACRKIETLMVAKFLFEALVKDYSAGISMDRASDMADGNLKSKLEIVRFGYLNYLMEFSSGMAVSRSGDRAARISTTSLPCLQAAFEKNKKDNGPAAAMDRAFGECR